MSEQFHNLKNNWKTQVWTEAWAPEQPIRVEAWGQPQLSMDGIDSSSIDRCLEKGAVCTVSEHLRSTEIFKLNS